jgi:hypothetical protein
MTNQLPHKNDQNAYAFDVEEQVTSHLTVKPKSPLPER